MPLTNESPQSLYYPMRPVTRQPGFFNRLLTKTLSSLQASAMARIVQPRMIKEPVAKKARAKEQAIQIEESMAMPDHQEPTKLAKAKTGLSASFEKLFSGFLNFRLGDDSCGDGSEGAGPSSSLPQSSDDNMAFQPIEQKRPSIAGEKPEIVHVPQSISPNCHASPENSSKSGTKKPLPSAEDQRIWHTDLLAMLGGEYKFHPDFTEKYRIAQIMGEGSFGFVLTARRLRDEKEMAIKFIRRDKVPRSAWSFDPELGLIPLEVQLLKNLAHPNIISFVDCLNSDKTYVYLVTELFGTPWTFGNPEINIQRNPGIRSLSQLKSMMTTSPLRRSPYDLFECIEAHHHLPEKTVYKIFSQIYEAAMYLNDNGLVHRDLKDENIVVDAEYNVKIIDFGSASTIPRSIGSMNLVKGSVNSAHSLDDNPHALAGSTESADGFFDKFNGTLAFAAPEIIKGHRYRPVEAEVWTLGILLYTLMFKTAPFPTEEAIVEKKLEFPFDEEEPGVLDLMRKMLQKEPTKRIGLEAIGLHPWMTRPEPFRDTA